MDEYMVQQIKSNQADARIAELLLEIANNENSDNQTLRHVLRLAAAIIGNVTATTPAPAPAAGSEQQGRSE